MDPVKLGYHITAYVNLDVLPGEKLVFYERMAEIPNVLECSCVTGDYSMELDAFIGEVQKYGKTNTQIVLSTPVGPRGADCMEAGDSFLRSTNE